MFVITHSAILKWLSFTVVGISSYVGYFWFEKNVQIRKILYVGVKIQINNFIFLILINFQGNDDWNDNPSTTFSNKKIGFGTISEVFVVGRACAIAVKLFSFIQG